jgi:hypothetical protein
MPVSQIVTNSIANDAVTTVDIANAAVTPAKLSQPLTSGTAQASTSGTSIDFTGIPSWVKRITVMFNGVSTNGTSNIIVQLGDSGGIETTGYFSSSSNQADVSNATTGVLFNDGSTIAAASLYDGALSFSNLSGNVWVAFGCCIRQTSNCGSIAGSKTLSATLDRLRITTVNGTDTFDAGSINILYE